MPVQQGKSALVTKLGQTFVTEFNKHKNDETSYSQFGDLPEGIENGIARLVECKFDVYKEGDNKGQYFFYAAGVVISPEEVGGIKVLGGRTSIMEALHDTPTRTRKTVGDHLAWILNEMRKLGLDTSKITHDQLEASAEALKKAQPFFRFRTWKGKKSTEGPYAGQEPRVQHTWNGACEYNEEGGSGGDGVVDESTPPPPPIGKPTQSGRKPQGTTSTTTTAPTPDEIDPPATNSSKEDLVDLDALASSADEGDTEAGETLQALAVEAGVSDDDVKNAANWVEVVGLIRNKQGSTEEPAADEGEDNWVPKKEEVYYYKPVVTDPKTKKKVQSTKAVECEVTAVDTVKKTVALKNLNDPKLKYSPVAWDELIGDE